MTQPASKLHYLQAILAEIGKVKGFVAGYDYDAYAANVMAQYATERAILNISEAVRNLEKHARRDDPTFQLATLSPHIAWSNIKGIGNILRHDYETVTPSRIWTVVTAHLDGLEAACHEALRQP
ncbi:DUF86 domain-containing protein [Asticcacaulis sp. AC402]|uniref:HepT-like ribonuclease domain-containing protein n=1 Tax=Asticcacaulis sp. AC402 TaxID=1282361 RepID=UPI00042856EF|nr:DUF86 domain-containing protein [Asticcacaulis sp. AC402]